MRATCPAHLILPHCFVCLIVAARPIKGNGPLTSAKCIHAAVKGDGSSAAPPFLFPLSLRILHLLTLFVLFSSFTSSSFSSVSLFILSSFFSFYSFPLVSSYCPLCSSPPPFLHGIGLPPVPASYVFQCSFLL